MSILKNGDASARSTSSTRIRDDAARSIARRSCRKELKVTLLFDQSIFVRAVGRRRASRRRRSPPGLTALMILLFLGSWRSTLIVVISIPLSILVSIIVLSALGQTLNVMTLGGLALAVGILVDDATVEIENIHRNMAQQKPHRARDPRRRAARSRCRRSSRRSASASSSCRSCSSPARRSRSSSRWRWPSSSRCSRRTSSRARSCRRWCATCSRARPSARARPRGAQHRRRGSSPRSSAASSGCATAYGGWLAWALAAPRVRRRRLRRCSSRRRSRSSRCVGRDFFPSVDAGLIKLHVRGAPGTRIEETEQRFAAIEDTIRAVIPPDEIETMLDNIGIPYSGHQPVAQRGRADLVGRRRDPHRAQGGPRARPPDYVRALRATLAQRRTPSTTFFFLAPDISTQVLNFGLAAPIDVQVVGRDRQRGRRRYAVAQQIAEQRARRSRARSTCTSRRSRSSPSSRIDVDRTMAQQVGLTERDVASDLLVSLSSSAQVAPSYWLDKRGVQYLVAVQTPQYEIDSIDALRRDADLDRRRHAADCSRNVATISRTDGAGEHHALQRRAHLRRPGQRRRHRPRLGRRRASQQVVAELQPHAAARHDGRASRARSRAWTSSFRGLALRPRLRGRARLPADGRQLPVVARPVHHPDGAARARSPASSGCSS